MHVTRPVLHHVSHDRRRSSSHWFGEDRFSASNVGGVWSGVPQNKLKTFVSARAQSREFSEYLDLEQMFENADAGPTGRPGSDTVRRCVGWVAQSFSGTSVDHHGLTHIIFLYRTLKVKITRRFLRFSSNLDPLGPVSGWDSVMCFID